MTKKRKPSVRKAKPRAKHLKLAPAKPSEVALSYDFRSSPAVVSTPPVQRATVSMPPPKPRSWWGALVAWVLDKP
jgi:hypothetical protein